MSEANIERGWTDMGEERDDLDRWDGGFAARQLRDAKEEDFVVVPYISKYPEMGDAYHQECGRKLWEHGLIDDGSNAGGGTTVCPKRRSFRTVGDLIRSLDYASRSVQGQEVTPMPDGSYQFEIADHGIHAYLMLEETSASEVSAT